MEFSPVTDNRDRHRFEMPLPDGENAYVSYREESNGLALNHTVVPEQWEGKGVAGALVKQVLDRARSQSVSILPYCPYVTAWLKRHPDYQELVAKDFEGEA